MEGYYVPLARQSLLIWHDCVRATDRWFSSVDQHYSCWSFDLPTTGLA